MNKRINRLPNFITTVLFVMLFTLVTGEFYPSLAAIEPQHQEHRLKIGLVLGGGGARGAAHVGVLKVLKELRIPIDYIAGTSMGAIVGGLYASGLSPEEIEELLTTIDWRDLFTDRPSGKDLSFRQKGDRRRLFDFEWGLKKGRLVFPRGIIAGQKLGFLLKSMTLQVTDIEDFDLLPIPFRALATDIETGEVVVLGNGNLAESMRASMSIPGVFTPVEVDGQILVDGGAVKNLPIDVAKEMGADLIIAVNVGTSLAKREKLESAIDITIQVIGIMTLKSVKEQIALLGEKDLLITPRLGDISSSNFEKAEEIIQIGERTALGLTEDLKKYSVSMDEYKYFLARHGREDTESVKIDFVKVKEPARV
ncbi:patatin-like phospholipase family protein, partial [Candidatus Omnitrophota bacterium]